jgi:hypothetical protein
MNKVVAEENHFPAVMEDLKCQIKNMMMAPHNAIDYILYVLKKIHFTTSAILE